MKARFSLLWVGMLVCQFLAAQVHIQVSDPETWSPESLRPYIGQTVTFDVPMVVTNNYSGLRISTRRIFSPTNQALPGSNAYYSILNRNNSGTISISGVPIAEGDAYYRLGQKIYNLTAYVNSTSSLRWISGELEGNTRRDLENADIRAMVNIDDCDECLLVCTMNLEYYLAENTGSGTMGPSSYAAHQRQRAKTSKALAKINADLYGLVEIEQGQQAAAEIASDLNANLPGRNYTYINDGGSASGTYTKSAFVYDKNKLKPIGKLQENDTRVQNRKKMICFEEIATGERFIFSVNHFKAKGTTGSGLDSYENDNGQGGFNQSRREEAQSVMDQYLTYQRNSLIQESDILLMGDLNSYGYEDPIILMINNGMIDLHRAFHADSSYSYNYRGEAGYLDHALCNGSLRPQVKGAAAFHINSDESDSYTYDKSNDQTMFRSSDHDPMLVGLHLDHTLTYDPSPILNSFEVLHSEADFLTISNAFKTGSNSYYAIYDIYGHPIKALTPLSQQVAEAVYSIEENHQKIELPSLSGMYILHVYYDYKVYTYKFIVR